jgi:hypothetical protein
MCHSTLQKYDTNAEVEFIKNFFTHNNWLYQPTMFRFDHYRYTPDFYDSERNVFIEVAGTRQAYDQNKDKYDIFRKTFPQINYEIRKSDGSILDETKDRLSWETKVTTVQELV